jgi:hypothetical protein
MLILLVQKSVKSSQLLLNEFFGKVGTRKSLGTGMKDKKKRLQNRLKPADRRYSRRCC